MTLVQTLMIDDTEMVVVPRAHYDKLLALSGDETAEDRVCIRLAEASERLRDAGESIALSMPAWDAIEAGASPIGYMREARGRGVVELATAAGVPLERLKQIENGAATPTDAELVAVATELQLTPAFLRNPLAA